MTLVSSSEWLIVVSLVGLVWTVNQYIISSGLLARVLLGNGYENDSDADNVTVNDNNGEEGRNGVITAITTPALVRQQQQQQQQNQQVLQRQQLQRQQQQRYRQSNNTNTNLQLQQQNQNQQQPWYRQNNQQNQEYNDEELQLALTYEMIYQPITSTYLESSLEIRTWSWLALAFLMNIICVQIEIYLLEKLAEDME